MVWPPREPEDATLVPYLNLAAITFGIDNNFLGERTAAEQDLRRLQTSGWITLQRSDAVATEQAKSPSGDPGAPARGNEMADYPEAMGPLVLGFSRLGSSVLASTEEGGIFENLKQTLRPNSNVRQSDVFDAMHLLTAARYGVRAFLTRDKNLLKRGDPIRTALGPTWGPTFNVWTPERALHQSVAAVRGLRAMAISEGFWLPTYPSDGEIQRLGAEASSEPCPPGSSADLTGFIPRPDLTPSLHSWDGERPQDDSSLLP
jgi:hypothetical protein